MSVVEVKPKNDFEKLKEAFKTLSINDVKPIFFASINTMKDLGEFTEALGKFEKKNPESYKNIADLSERPETVFISLLDKIPANKFKPIVSLVLELVKVQNELNNIKSLSADKKIELGRALQEVANKIIKNVGEIE